MVKEIKYLLYITVITLFFFFTIKYYLSDQFKKKVYRTHNNYELTIINKKPQKYLNKIQLKFDKDRAIADYISGMTDRYAINLYKKNR